MDAVQMVPPAGGAYYTQQQSNIVVSPTSVSGGVGEVLSNTERTLQSWKHSLYVHDFAWCCCKRETKRFELEVSSERVTVRPRRQQETPKGERERGRASPPWTRATCEG